MLGTTINATLRDPRIAIITDEPGWHGRELLRAFAARGREGVYVSSMACAIELDGQVPTIRLPQFEGLPAGVFVRGIPGGTLEQVILRLDVLHALREMGVVVYNDARAIERTVDKAMTSFLLMRNAIPTPPTWIVESPTQARGIVIRELGMGHRLVAKPLFGSQGIGVRMVASIDDLANDEGLNGVFYLQRFVEKSATEWCDLRVFVIAGEAIAAMYRRNAAHWLTNRAQGGHCERAQMDEGLRALAVAAARAVQIEYAGVDLIPLADGGYTVTEVNSIPAWQGLQSVVDINIADRLTGSFFARIDAATDLA